MLRDRSVSLTRLCGYYPRKDLIPFRRLQHRKAFGAESLCLVDALAPLKGNTMKSSDYTIEKTRKFRDGSEKFKIICGGKTVTTRQTREQAEDTIKSLVSDPWFFDRGQTRKDRNG